MRSAAFRRELGLVPALRLLLTRHVCVLHTQLAQAAACNNFHTLDKRFASCLLTTHDRSSGHSFHLTQKLFGQLLGVRRVGVTNAAGILQKRRLIRYSRVHITIFDRPGLKKATCGCDQTAKDATNAFSDQISAP